MCNVIKRSFIIFSALFLPLINGKNKAESYPVESTTKKADLVKTPLILMATLSFCVFTVLVVCLPLNQEKTVSNGKIVEKYHKDENTRLVHTMVGLHTVLRSVDVPERWVFVLKQRVSKSSREWRKGEVDVSKEIFDSLEVGDQYLPAEVPSK